MAYVELLLGYLDLEVGDVIVSIAWVTVWIRSTVGSADQVWNVCDVDEAGVEVSKHGCGVWIDLVDEIVLAGAER